MPLRVKTESASLLAERPASSTKNPPRTGGSPNRTAPFTEAHAWKTLPGGWRPLYGNFSQLGFSIEWHDFDCAKAIEWDQSFHPDGVEICLNLAGHGRLAFNGTQMDLPPLSHTYYYRGSEPLRAWRLPSGRHQFLTVELARDFAARHLEGREAVLAPAVREVLRGEVGESRLATVDNLTLEQQQFVTSLRHPPVSVAAQPIWYLAKVLELCAQIFFKPQGEFFCERHKRVARERVDKTIQILRNRLAEPPDLDELGRQVGCSPFYLSRTFSREMRMTIPQYLRQLRMERAAELLRSGRHNVTEAAMEVGYSSLSHFSQAFCQTIGCCPNLYPQMAAARDAQRHDDPPAIP
jgi:AraC family transcriptional regulator